MVTKHRADLPVLCSCFPLAIYFTFGSVYMSMPLSHFVHYILRMRKLKMTCLKNHRKLVAGEDRSQGALSPGLWGWHGEGWPTLWGNLIVLFFCPHLLRRLYREGSTDLAGDYHGSRCMSSHGLRCPMRTNWGQIKRFTGHTSPPFQVVITLGCWMGKQRIFLPLWLPTLLNWRMSVRKWALLFIH